jgi:hypothetical protein
MQVKEVLDEGEVSLLVLDSIAGLLRRVAFPHCSLS